MAPLYTGISTDVDRRFAEHLTAEPATHGRIRHDVCWPQRLLAVGQKH